MVHHFAKVECTVMMHTHSRLHIQFIDLQISISNKNSPMGGLDECHDIPPSEEFPPGRAKYLVYRICSGEDLGFPR